MNKVEVAILGGILVLFFGLAMILSHKAREAAFRTGCCNNSSEVGHARTAVGPVHRR